MKLFSSYDSPNLSSRAVMAAGDVISRLFVLRQPQPRLPLDARHTPSLLLLRLDGVGDNICSWPALKLLREQLPATRISLVVGPWVAPLYHECPWVDEVIEWDSGLFGLFRGKGVAGVRHDVEMATMLRQRGFTAGIDLRGDLLSILLLRLIAPPIRISTVARGGSRLLTDPLQPFDRHETGRTYDIACASLGLPSGQKPHLSDWQRPEAMHRTREKLRLAGWDQSQKTVALSPRALWEWKQWPKDRFSELADRLKRKMGVQILWLLEEEAQATEYSSGDPVFCGPLDEVAAALSLCTLAVSNDSGLMHLAIATGCPTVQLFGPGDADHFAHKGETVALHHDRSCNLYPCTRSGTCRNIDNGWCMEKIGVDEVYASCYQLLTIKG